MKPYELNDKFPDLCTWKYKNETIKEALLKDSGYVKELILLNEKFVLSESAFEEAKQITRGFVDTRDEETKSDPSKAKKTPFDFDFNDEKLRALNKEKLSK